MKTATGIARVLTINGGSSSIKFALFEACDSLRRKLEGRIERIGFPWKLSWLGRVNSRRHSAGKLWLNKWPGSESPPMDFVIIMRTKRWPCLVVLVVLALTSLASPGQEKFTYYVQLVRGNDDGQPPTPEAKPIGPKLSESLASVFRWKHFWEIHRQEVEIASGTKTNVVLINERSVEIDLLQPPKRKVTVFSNKKAVSTMTQRITDAMTIIGADRDSKSSWFVVVRRDRPRPD